ncbi:MAG TPA: phosphoenolpyruvate--protein phosphotransferase [Rhodospirillales bacterium]|nr:phosphoenolpyruvate--protein phosphotransferase [Rhodospirillales bacterium]
MIKNGPKKLTVNGLGVSPGIGIGVVHVRHSGAISVSGHKIPARRVAAEQKRFMDAVKRARRQIGRLRNKAKSMPGTAAEELGYLLDAYDHMLRGSRLVRGVERRIADARINAEAAVQAEFAEISAGFAAMDDAYLAARLDDIREVANRLVRNLTKASVKTPTQFPKGSVVVAEELTPADTALMDPRRVAAIATVLGGAEGHTAIMARALRLPAVLGAPGLLRTAKSGDAIVVDGTAGEIIINPTPATLAAYGRKRDARQKEEKRLARLRRLRAVTLDGIEIKLRANVELPIEMSVVSQVGAAGIGLLRSEFMFMNRGDMPTEDEQYRILRDMVDAAGGRSVTIRTLDAGGEKTTAALMEDFGESTSSALGLRGVRVGLKRTDILETQFQAILRAGVRGKVRILLPMVTSVSEVRRVREVLTRAARRLKRRGVAIADPLPPLGVMIEVPGAALSADALAQVSDFLAVGSNDLTMYTLAIDRSDEQVAHLYDPLHPAVLRLIQFTADAGLRARIPVTICGEMAGDSRYTALLLGFGFRELSMTAMSIPRVKQRLRSIDTGAARRRAGVIMEQMDSGRIATLIDDFNALA